MYQGNWKCSTCGGAITELPFQPRSEAGLTCRTCYAKQRNQDTFATPADLAVPVADEAPDIPDFAEVASGPDDRDDGFGPAVTPGEKPRFAGNWTCATCGGSITSLPFTPRNTSNLKCIDCFKSSKA